MPSLSVRTLLFATALSLAVNAPSALAQVPVTDGWGVARTDVPADPRIRLGTLPNGLHYAIMRNETPKGAASVRLRFGFGSLMEAEDERGLAHFIEHMAFNGTTNVPEGEMVKRLERLGLAFGPDTNAITGFDSTTYLLELPVADTERVDTALFLMREVASEILFDPDAIQRERGVILGERRSRDGYQLHQLIDRLDHIMPAASYSRRLPIGTPKVLIGAKAETMRNLYRRYYRPENAVLVFVGDIDPDVIEAKIKTKFAGWTGVGPAGASPSLGKVDLTRPTDFDTFRNQNVPTGVSLTVLKPWEEPADTRAERRESLLESIGNAILSQRLTRLVNKAGTPLLGALRLSEDWRNLAQSESIFVSARDGDWIPALSTAENELRKAVAYGFNATELKRELAQMATGFRNAAAQANTRRNPALAATILSTVDGRDFVTDPAWRLSFFEQVLPSLTLDAVNTAFHAQWTGSPPQIHVTEKQPVNEVAIMTVWSMAGNVAVSLPGDEGDKQFAYDSFGPPGKVVADDRIDGFGIRTVRFANNVRLNIKKTDFESGRVRFSVRMAGGLLSLPTDKPGLAIMLTTLSAVGGTGKQSFEEIKEVLAGKVYSAGSAVGADAFVSSGITTPEDLGLQMKVSAAYLTDPGYRPEAAQRWANMVPVIDKQFDSQPQSVFATRVPVALMGEDYRFGAPRADVLLKRNFQEARATLALLLASAPIEIGIVGDIDEEAAVLAVAQSFGALPTRSERAPDYTGARAASLRADASPITMFHNGPAYQALVAAFWSTDDDDNYRREIGLSMLGKALELKLTDTIREQLGASYGVNVESAMSDVYDGFGTLGVSTMIAPESVDKVERAIDEAVKALVEAPIDDDLFKRARAPMLESLTRSRRENSWWLNIVDEAQGKGDRLDRIRQQETLYHAITPAELQQLAATYLRPEGIRRVRVLSNKYRGRVAVAR